MADVDFTETITHLSLCSGYDGIGLGLRRVWPNVREIAHVEIEAFAAANLVTKMEAGELGEAPVWTDLKTFPAWRFRGCVDILSAGFPCQPFSCAGARAADDDPRHLWPHVRQAIGLIRPGMVVLENVEGIISSKLKGSDWNDPEGTPVLLHVLRELERTGYRCTWGVFSASEVGASHQRKRVFIVGVADTEGTRTWMDSRECRDEGGNSCGGGTEGIRQGDGVTQNMGIESSDTGSKELGNPEHDGLHAESESGGITKAVRLGPKRENCTSESEGANRSGELADPTSFGGGQDYGAGEAGLLDQADAVQRGWPARPGEEQYEWEEPRTVEPRLGGATNGTSSRVDPTTHRVDRLRLLGNGVVPGTCERAVRVLLEELMESEL